MVEEVNNNGHDPVNIASFLFTLIDNNKSLTLIHLNKLPYIAHGFSLALTDRPLSNEEPEAWPYGPVFKSIFNKFKPLGDVIKKEIIENDPVLGENHKSFSELEIKIIKKVFTNYKEKCGWTLSDLTHQKGSPWYQVWHKNKQKSGHVISNKIIKEYYKNLLSRA